MLLLFSFFFFFFFFNDTATTEIYTLSLHDALPIFALEIALAHELDEASTCFFWLSDRCFQRDEYVDAIGYLDEALALTRKRGDRPGEWSVLAERTYPLVMLGRWDESQTVIDEFTPEQIDAGGL